MLEDRMPTQLAWSRAVDAARAAGIQAAQACADAADRAEPGWQDAAFNFLRAFAADPARADGWLTEDVIRDAADCGFPGPPDLRAWGQVIRRAIAAGLIRRVGVRGAVTSHGSLKPTWGRAA